MDELAAALQDAVRGRVIENQPLAALNTYRLGGAARLYVEPEDAEDLVVLGRVLRSHDHVEVVPLGRGSNVVISDSGFDGIVLRIANAFSWIHAAGDRGLRAGAATSLPLLANWTSRRALAGLEFTVGIPGSVGGAVRMNAGAHGQEVKDHLRAASVFSLDALVLEERPASSLGLRYRGSELSERDIVLDATFELVPDEAAAIRKRIETYRKHRAQTQPGALSNAGSVFKNPPGDSAGRLVEAAGLKGFSVGGARVSELHANFFVAQDGASAQDVFDLVHEVRRRVRDASRVELVPEIRFVGRFEPARRVGR